MSQHLSETTTIGVAAERVGNIAGGPARIDESASARSGALVTDGSRVCPTEERALIRERILGAVEGRFFEYATVEFPVTPRPYHSRLEVSRHDRCADVEWEADGTAEDEALESDLAATFATIYRDGLAQLRARVEGGRA